MPQRSPHKKEKNENLWSGYIEYFLILDAPAELPSLLAPLEDVDKLDGARVSEQVKSQTSGKILLHRIKVISLGLLPSLQHIFTGLL